MSHFELLSGQGSKHIRGRGRVWAGRVSLTSGTASINYTADLPGLEADFDNEPIIIVTGKQAPNEVGVSAAGTSTATVSDGSGASTDDVNVLIVEDPDGDA